MPVSLGISLARCGGVTLACVLQFVSYRQLEKQLTFLFYMIQPGFAGSRSSSSALPKQATAAI